MLSQGSSSRLVWSHKTVSWKQHEHLSDNTGDNIANISAISDNIADIGDSGHLDMARDMNIDHHDNNQDKTNNGADSVIQAKLVIDYVTLVTHTKVECLINYFFKGECFFHASLNFMVILHF